MLTREEIDFHRKVINELREIRRALEKIAGDSAKDAPATDKGKDEKDGLREV